MWKTMIAVHLQQLTVLINATSIKCTQPNWKSKQSWWQRQRVLRKLHNKLEHRSKVLKGGLKLDHIVKMLQLLHLLVPKVKLDPLTNNRFLKPHNLNWIYSRTEIFFKTILLLELYRLLIFHKIHMVDLIGILLWLIANKCLVKKYFKTILIYKTQMTIF